MSVASISETAMQEKKRTLVLESFTPDRIVALGHAISGKLAGTYRDENITIPEWRVLAVISQAERVAARDVVRRTPMDKMTVSRAVVSLELKGFVKREPDPQDRRVSALLLSNEGRALFDRIAALALDFEDALLAGLEPEEAEMFRAVLAKLEHRANMTDTQSASGS